MQKPVSTRVNQAAGDGEFSWFVCEVLPAARPLGFAAFQCLGQAASPWYPDIEFITIGVLKKLLRRFLMTLDDLVHNADIRYPFSVLILEGALVGENPQFLNAALVYALIQMAPKGWWWCGSKQGTDATADYSMCGGNPFEVPGAVTVSPETAWKAIGGMYLLGGRDTSLNWVEADDLSHIIDDDNAFP